MKTALLIIVTLVSGIFLIVHYRKIARECESRHLESFNLFSFWFKIDDLWKKSKRPGNEPLYQALLVFVLALGLLFSVILFSLI